MNLFLNEINTKPVGITIAGLIMIEYKSSIKVYSIQIN